MRKTGIIDHLLEVNEFAWSLYNANPANAEKRNMNSQDIKILIENFESNQVQYLLIGGFAMAFQWPCQDLKKLILTSALNERKSPIIMALKSLFFGPRISCLKKNKRRVKRTVGTSPSLSACYPSSIEKTIRQIQTTNIQGFSDVTLSHSVWREPFPHNLVPIKSCSAC